MKTLVLGLGNPILSDDGVGFYVIEQLNAKVNKLGVTFAESSASGLRLLEEIVDYDKLIIIDAIQTAEGKTGEVYRLNPEDLDKTRRTLSSHGLSFADALALGKKVGLALPQQITIFAVEVKDISTFSSHCTPEVEKAIPKLVDMVIWELSESG